MASARRSISKRDGVDFLANCRLRMCIARYTPSVNGPLGFISPSRGMTVTDNLSMRFTLIRQIFICAVLHRSERNRPEKEHPTKFFNNMALNPYEVRRSRVKWSFTVLDHKWDNCSVGTMPLRFDIHSFRVYIPLSLNRIAAVRAHSGFYLVRMSEVPESGNLSQLE